MADTADYPRVYLVDDPLGEVSQLAIFAMPTETYECAYRFATDGRDPPVESPPEPIEYSVDG